MKRIKLAAFIILFVVKINPASSQLTTLPDGGNKKAMVQEQVGLTTITINYHRPGVKGREGKIWGDLVYEGYSDLGFGTSKASPWRAGANENTTIEFSGDVQVEGKKLAAGKYGFYIVWDKLEPTLIFSRTDTLWGSYSYNDKDDALRVKVKPVALNESVEWLRYEFLNQADSSVVVALEWEKIRIPFTVSVNYKADQLSYYRNELKIEKNRNWQSLVQAANFTAEYNVALDEGLNWAEAAISDPAIGEKNLQTYSAKANVLLSMGKTAEADLVMKEGIKYGKMLEIHMYARKLLSEKKTAEAFEAFKLNLEKHPGEFTTEVGMARAYSAQGKYKKAIEFAEKAYAHAPDDGNKKNLENMITKLKENKDVN